MNEALSSEIRKLEMAFEHMEHETPFLRPALRAFREVMVSRTIIKADLCTGAKTSVSPADSGHIGAGHPLLTAEAIASFVEPWGDKVNSMVQPLLKAFPSIKSETLQLTEAFETGALDLKYCIHALVEGSEDDVCDVATQLGIRPAALKFVLGQILKPFVERGTEDLRPIIQNIVWEHGYCPICGSFPELSYLTGPEGQRWLRCSLCAYEWRFDRMACPYCGGRDENKEFISIDGMEHEWVEFCAACHRYVVGIDLRKNGGLTKDVAAIGMIHLDLIAQRRGFAPVAECAWNIVSGVTDSSQVSRN